MSLDVRIGCSVCGYFETNRIDLPFNCDDYICPKCRQGNCLYIIAVNENMPVRESGSDLEMLLKQLERVRRL